MPKIMADHNVEGHLQVLMTIWSSPDWDDLWTGLSCRLMRERDYAERVAAQLLDYLLDLDNLRGTGRLYVP